MRLDPGGVQIAVDVDSSRRIERAHHAEAASEGSSDRFWETTLVDAIESLEDGLLLYDADDQLVLSNRRVLELVPAVADVIKPGVRFEEVVRAAAERGYYRDASGGVDEVVSGRLRARCCRTAGSRCTSTTIGSSRSRRAGPVTAAG